MSAEKRIIEEIEKLPKETKRHVLKKLQEKYFLGKDTFVVGENYDFWLNEKDEEYESDV